MSRPQPSTMIHTREAYRRWCAAQEGGRFERVDGQIVAMAPERASHARTKGRVFNALQRAIQMAGVACEAFPDGVTVETGDSDYEPDALVNCGPPMDDDAISAPNPVIVVEALSPTTAATDTGGKLADYFDVPSIGHYLIVHPTKRRVIHHRRGADGSIETWIVVSGAIILDPPGINVMLDEFYPAA